MPPLLLENIRPLKGDVRLVDRALILDAVAGGNVRVVRALLEEDADLALTRGAGGLTLLQLAAARGKAAVAELLLERGADVNARDADGATALHAAARSGSLKTCWVLLEGGANIRLRDRIRDLTPFGWACLDGSDPDLAALLLEAGAEPDVFTAVAMGAEPALRQVLHDFPYAVNARLSPRDDRRQPLHLAVLTRRPRVLRILLRRGADVRGRTASGKTALELAYEGTCGRTVDLLQQAERGPHRRGLLCARIAGSGDLTGLLPSIWRLMNPRV